MSTAHASKLCSPMKPLFEILSYYETRNEDMQNCNFCDCTTTLLGASSLKLHYVLMPLCNIKLWARVFWLFVSILKHVHYVLYGTVCTCRLQTGIDR